MPEQYGYDEIEKVIPAHSEEMMNNVGLIGFICPNGEQHEYSYCFTKCKNPCYSLPLLASLVSDRTVVPNSYGVLEVLDPPQITYLKRHNSWFSTPEDLIWMGFGSGWHSVIEKGGKALGIGHKHQMEIPVETEVDGTRLRGRVDYYNEETNEMIDYKTLKWWFIKNYRKTGDMSHYALQTNVYRTYWFPDTKTMLLEALIKDWSERIGRTENVKPIERIPVPFIDDEEVRSIVLRGIRTQKLLEAGDTAVVCTKEETWHGRRCRAYCPVAKVCPQLRGT